MTEPDAGDMAVAQNFFKGEGRMYDNAFLLRLFNLLIVCQHLFSCFEAGEVNGFSTQTACSPCTVKCDIAAAEDDDMFAHAGRLSRRSIEQEISVEQDAVQIIALHRQPDTLMGTDCQQDCVVFFCECCEVIDPAVGLDFDACVLQIGRLFRDDVTGKTVGGNTIGHLTAQRRISFFQDSFMTLFCQIEGCRHAGRTTADDTDTFAGLGEVFAVGLPQGVVGMLSSVAFEVANRDRFIDLTTAAVCLTGVCTDITQAFREGKPFMDNRHRFVITPLLNQTDITRDIGMDRAGRLTGDQLIFFLNRRKLDHIADGTGRTYFCTCTAETAVSVLEQFVMQGADIGFHLVLVVLQNADAAQVVAGAYTPSAQDTAVHIMDEQRFFIILCKAFDTGAH